MEQSRFRDKGENIYNFLESVLVECPRCHQCAKITGNPIKINPKLICEKCGLTGFAPFVSYGNLAEYCGLNL